jgi:cytochrome b6
MNAQNKLYKWFNERIDLDSLVKFMEHKTVPMGSRTIWYYMGGITLFLFLVQVTTGILLLFYYKPGPDSAYESVQFIMSHVEFGWLIRSLHSWSANLMVFFAFVHMFSVYFLKAYRKPREITWLTGFLLLVLVLAFGFSGYLLPWNELAFFATKVGTEVVGVVPVIGRFLLVLLRGGEDVTGATLTRFFGIHVSILPLIFIVILGVHLLLVQIQGMSEHFGPRDKKKYIRFFPNFMLRDFVAWLIVLNILLILSVFFPWELGEKADLFAPAPAGIRPEWYFLFMFETLKYIPAKVLFIEGELLGVLGFAIGGLLWMLVPFIDSDDNSRLGGKKASFFGTFVLAFIIIMTILALI